MVESAIVRLAVGGRDYSSASKAQAVVAAMHEALTACQPADWPMLWSKVIVCGPCAVHEEFLELLETDVRWWMGS